MQRGLILALAFAMASGVGDAIASSAAPAELVGLWEARRHFGPEIGGTLVIVRRDDRLLADIGGFSVAVRQSGRDLAFELPDAKGTFRGRTAADGMEIHGFWIQPPSITRGNAYASPVTLKRVDGAWRGTVTPLQESFGYYLPVTARDGGLETFLRNPEQNVGIFAQVKRLELSDGRVRLMGNRRGRGERQALYEGRFDAGRLTVFFPDRGGAYEFARVEPHATSAFHPRGRSPGKYRYAPPLARDDGWPTARLEEVGISRPAIEALIQRLIDAPMTGVSDSQIHSLLIARHGKLVLEEYFHGHHRDKPHDTRSAAKSLAAVLIGAAMQDGIAVGESTPVYATMLGKVPADLDPRKRAMRLEHLLTMTGGHHCNDGDPNAPGNEDVMQEQQAERDWYRYILAVPMDRTPGEKLVYCSIDAHLAGGVLARAAGEPLPELFDRLVAKPLRMGPYHLLLAPTGEAYMGGGAHFLPRDFMKLAQLMVNDGRWDGKQIISRAWARKSGAALRDLTRIQQYGYLWNSAEYPYRDRKVRAFFAAGNGGQIFMGIPDLDLVIAFTGGNYSDAALFIPQRKLVPEFLLPAVD